MTSRALRGGFVRIWPGFRTSGAMRGISERYESHHAAMLYMTFCAVGADVRAEESSSRGRSDMVLLHRGQVFVLELKMAREGEKTEAAMARAMKQMRDRGYADKYNGSGEPIHLVGAVFKALDLLAVRAERF